MQQAPKPGQATANESGQATAPKPGPATANESGEVVAERWELGDGEVALGAALINLGQVPRGRELLTGVVEAPEETPTRWTAALGVPIFFSSSAAGMLASTAPRHERISPADAGVPRRATASARPSFPRAFWRWRRAAPGRRPPSTQPHVRR